MKKSLMALSIAGTAALPLATVANACGGTGEMAANHDFVTPSGNIVCTVYAQGEGVNCQVREHAWVQPASTVGPHGRPCNFRFGGLEFYVSNGNPGKLGCYEGSSNFTASNLTTLDYGQTHAHGSISCASELSGVTCTDTVTGHFIRVSRENYDLG